MRFIPGHGYVIDGQNASRAEVIGQVRAELIKDGVHHLDADAVLADRPGLVQRAWWAGDAIGFCNETHPDAVPVTVVNVPGANSAEPAVQGRSVH